MSIIKLGNQSAKIRFKDEYYLFPENGFYEVSAEIEKLITEKVSGTKILTKKDVDDFNTNLIAEAEAKKIVIKKVEPGKKAKSEVKKEVKKKK